jgi:hypothetical protein
MLLIAEFSRVPRTVVPISKTHLSSDWRFIGVFDGESYFHQVSRATSVVLGSLMGASLHGS